jgi:hypothetical protein
MMKTGKVAKMPIQINEEKRRIMIANDGVQLPIFERLRR